MTPAVRKTHHPSPITHHWSWLILQAEPSDVTRLALMADRQDEYAIARFVVAIEGKVPASAARDHDFAEIRLGMTTDERVILDDRDSRKDQFDGLVCRRGIGIHEE